MFVISVCLLFLFVCYFCLWFEYTIQLRAALSGNGIVAEAAEDRKMRKHAALPDDFHFLPIAAETLGGWGPSALQYISTLGKRLICESGEPRA